MFVNSGFKQHILTPTHDSSTIIDHIYTHHCDDANINTEVIDCYYSDHDIVTCSLLNERKQDI